MDENEIAKRIVDVAFRIHKALGPGLLESVYQAVMVYELRKEGLEVHEQVAFPLSWDGLYLDIGFRADLVVNRLVIVELKSAENLARVHRKILLTYLRLTDRRLGLLINFGEELIRDGITRLVNGLTETPNDQRDRRE